MLLEFKNGIPCSKLNRVSNVHMNEKLLFSYFGGLYTGRKLNVIQSFILSLIECHKIWSWFEVQEWVLHLRDVWDTQYSNVGLYFQSVLMASVKSMDKVVMHVISCCDNVLHLILFLVAKKFKSIFLQVFNIKERMQR